jgi:hypothetical protein
MVVGSRSRRLTRRCCESRGPVKLNKKLDFTDWCNVVQHLGHNDPRCRWVKHYRFVLSIYGVTQRSCDHHDFCPHPFFGGMLAKEPSWYGGRGESGCPFVGFEVIGPLEVFTQTARQGLPEFFVTPLLAQRPGAIAKRRLMPHMLAMSTIEVRDPVTGGVLRKIEDGSVHRWRSLVGEALPVMPESV